MDFCKIKSKCTVTSGINKRAFLNIDSLTTVCCFLIKYNKRGNRKNNKLSPLKLFSELMFIEMARTEANKETRMFFV
jgi:hypothetical protein